MTEFYGTIAHEFQHLINYTWSLEHRNKNNTGPARMETWIDEGLSAAAEYIYDPLFNSSRIDYFNEGTKTLAKGNNFYVWGENDAVILDEYATVYLFFQWLYIQANNDPGIYKKIFQSEYTDHRAVTEAAAALFTDKEGWDGGIDGLLKNWYLANYVNKDNGLLGYRGVYPDLKVTPAEDAELSFRPGEGAFSILPASGSWPPGGDSGPNIVYTGVVKNTGDLSGPSGPTGDMLLTFNRNVINRASLKETGYLTGNPAPKGSVLQSGRTAAPLRPFPIDPVRPPGGSR
ncbi:hypothetical protein FACS1894151_11610 [Spirochaetia bacterium]|nr:hypothetical protein FACS1894151_11610 [Spirochaetia bacterium]